MIKCLIYLSSSLTPCSIMEHYNIWIYIISLLQWIILRGIWYHASLSSEIYIRFLYETDTAVTIDSWITEDNLRAQHCICVVLHLSTRCHCYSMETGNGLLKGMEAVGSLSYSSGKWQTLMYWNLTKVYSIIFSQIGAHFKVCFGCFLKASLYYAV